MKLAIVSLILIAVVAAAITYVAVAPDATRFQIKALAPEPIADLITLSDEPGWQRSNEFMPTLSYAFPEGYISIESTITGFEFGGSQASRGVSASDGEITISIAQFPLPGIETVNDMDEFMTRYAAPDKMTDATTTAGWRCVIGGEMVHHTQEFSTDLGESGIRGCIIVRPGVAFMVFTGGPFSLVSQAHADFMQRLLVKD